MEKIIRFYNQNRRKIYKWIAIIASLFLLLKLMNVLTKERNQEELLKYRENSTNEKNEVVLNNTTSSNNKEQKNKDIIDEFLEYCKNSESYDKAYELLAEETKNTEKYNSKEKFVNSFITTFYKEPENCKKVELNSVERMYMLEKYSGDILSTGNVSDVERIYLNINSEKNKNRIVITDYAEKKLMNKSILQDGINIKINSAMYFYDYTEYEIEITNNTNSIFYIDSLVNTYLELTNKKINVDDIKYENNVKPNSSEIVKLKFKILYIEKPRINYLKFNMDGNNEAEIEL